MAAVDSPKTEVVTMASGICQNRNCGSSYEIKEGQVDDGYCCFPCWEEENCSEPIHAPAVNVLPEYVNE